MMRTYPGASTITLVLVKQDHLSVVLAMVSQFPWQNILLPEIMVLLTVPTLIARMNLRLKFWQSLATLLVPGSRCVFSLQTKHIGGTAPPDNILFGGTPDFDKPLSCINETF